MWRFLAYAKPYRHYVIFATVCGLIKFLAPLVFPWMLKVLLDPTEVVERSPNFSKECFHLSFGRDVHGYGQQKAR